MDLPRQILRHRVQRSADGGDLFVACNRKSLLEVACCKLARCDCDFMERSPHEYAHAIAENERERDRGDNDEEQLESAHKERQHKTNKDDDEEVPSYQS